LLDTTYYCNNDKKSSHTPGKKWILLLLLHNFLNCFIILSVVYPHIVLKSLYPKCWGEYMNVLSIFLFLFSWALL
jgi:hypothetical protein